MQMPDLQTIAISFSAVLLGGVLKGATGAGAPVVGVPILSLFFGVPFAVSVFVVSNLVSNIWQGWQFRAHLASPRFTLIFAGAGAVGAGVGSLMLAFLPAEMLMLMVAVIVLAYIGFRIVRPGWQLAQNAANRLVGPVGFLGGILQGAGGVSAPVSVTFLNAMRLPRPQFIVTISLFFFMMSVVQIPALWSLGVLTGERTLIGFLTLVPIFGGIAIGQWLAARLPAQAFDRVTLLLLFAISLKLIWGAVV
ncbi:sulfite exporter TauE/SafE family protein [Primorskyibacter sp. 2E233]|uniref:sulfite exporter TauE/SafE family protein n=1 Tax=Primorskyibacter sp. 2E233 TaxID=3413431 RepID=UPI003BF3CFB8